MDRTCPGPRAANEQEVLDLGLYLDGVLPESSARAVEDHLASCEECRARLQDVRRLKGILEDRTVWRTAQAVGGCLSAAEMLLALEGSGSERFQQHILECEACRTDVTSIEDSTADFAAGKLERPATPLMGRLRDVGRPGDDVLAPIIVLPGSRTDEALRPASSGKVKAPVNLNGKAPSKRLSPRPSKRITTARPVAREGRSLAGIFGFAAAAAAAVIVALIAAQSGTTNERPAGTVAQETPRPKKKRVPAKGTPAPTTKTNTGSSTSPENPTIDEPDAPIEPDPGAPAPQEPPQESPVDTTPTPGPAPQVPPASEGGPTVAKREPAAEAAPLDTPVADDGAAIEVDLSRLAGAVTVRAAGQGETGSWTTLGRKDGRLALKAGDRIRSSSGAFLSLEGGTYEVCLAPRTELVVRGAARGPVVGLAEGRVLFEVAKLPADKRLVVATNSGDFECVGTVFSVAVDDKRATCAVDEGTVLVRAQSGAPRPLGAGYMVALTRGAAAPEPKVAPDSHDAWARSWRPERQVVYAATFDRGDPAGFTGALTPEGSFRDAGRSLVFEPVDGNKFWGLAAKAPRGRVKSFRAVPDLRLQFSFWLEQESHVLVQILNERQGKNFKRDLGVNPAGRWVTATIPVMDLETYFDPGKNPVREGDLFNEIEIYTGAPGETWKALLDDVLIYKKSYR